jgi:archaellum component FlaF (FlaF/FlaG flagellin family)
MFEDGKLLIVDGDVDKVGLIIKSYVNKDDENVNIVVKKKGIKKKKVGLKNGIKKLFVVNRDFIIKIKDYGNIKIKLKNIRVKSSEDSISVNLIKNGGKKIVESNLEELNDDGIIIEKYREVVFENIESINEIVISENYDGKFNRIESGYKNVNGYGYIEIRLIDNKNYLWGKNKN